MSSNSSTVPMIRVSMAGANTTSRNKVSAPCGSKCGGAASGNRIRATTASAMLPGKASSHAVRSAAIGRRG